MCRVIAVSNQKGGVGKTVSCVNLGIGLAQSGKKVLLIDADPQGSMTISLGYPEPDDMEYSLASMMMNIVNDEPLNMDKTILHHKEGVDLIPANIECRNQNGREQSFENAHHQLFQDQGYLYSLSKIRIQQEIL